MDISGASRLRAVWIVAPVFWKSTRMSQALYTCHQESRTLTREALGQVTERDRVRDGIMILHTCQRDRAGLPWLTAKTFLGAFQ